MAKQKYYVVWKGRKPGIYKTWAECERQTKGFQGASFKSFPTLAEAEQAYKQGGFSSSSAAGKSSNAASSSSSLPIDENSISVDAACSGNPGMMEYQGVDTKTGERIFHYGPVFGTNNIGEFLGIVHALVMLKKQGKNTTIYSDSMTALSWVRNKKANTSLTRDSRTEQLWQMIERAEAWLKENSYENKIIKWETHFHGEIKADFGRK
ncbi:MULTISPECIES: ribonuclease H family protein [unclassified Niallia]|uniref:ribonuclease H1 domain-containing protein n=1 Tax=unclassified Niallia TaxID=2837522 RepID=UPI001EDC4EF1|nr:MULTISPECIES: ribonuclease H family protein [unclassified Niallia]MDL0434779.1 ribonuclease H family protein [Niallia sp. SS-2023]UPO89399.1 ribonuclease H family protein [Niallia sp. Man26]